MFADQAKITCRAGDGGNGCSSFDRSRFFRHPRPTGGNGGDGGSIVLEADSNVGTLLDFQFKRHFKAESGTHGEGSLKKGKGGSDCIIRVPAGTVVHDDDTGETLRDLNQHGLKVIVCRGGIGGRGNHHSGEATQGTPGEERRIRLELKLIADVGLIGFPNAGKSTLISKLSSAKSKSAAFPFTTQFPVLGVVRTSDDEHIVLADLPGIIEGAHEGKGLGFQFLRHIERTKILVHLIDMAAVDGRDPVSDYHQINQELMLYSRVLSKKPQIIAANKMDLTEAKKHLECFTQEIKITVIPISAATGQGLTDLMKEVIHTLHAHTQSEINAG